MLKRHAIQVLRASRPQPTARSPRSPASPSEASVASRLKPTVAHVDDAGERDAAPDWPAVEGGAVSAAASWSCSRRSPTLLVGRDLPAREAGRLSGRQERALRADPRDPAEAPRPAGPLRGPARRILAARFRPGRRALPGRDEEARPLLRLAAEVLALGGGDDRAGRAGRDAGPHAGGSLRRDRRHSALGGVRSAEDDRVEVEPRTARSRSGIRSSRASRSISGWGSNCAGRPARSRKDRSRIWSAGSRGRSSSSGDSSTTTIC